MSYNAIVTRLKNVRPHPNADRVKLATCHGNQVVIGLDAEEDQIGIYFNSDGQLSDEFCYANNLYRDPHRNKFPDEKGGMFDVNRRVRAQRFRGEISDGFWVPMSHLAFIGRTDSLEVGDEFDTFEGVKICNKYVNPATLKIARENQGKKSRNAKTSIMFKEHFDTAHFGKNLHEFDLGQTIVVTEKLHGTSGRVGHVQVERNLSWLEKIAKRFNVEVQETEWKYMNGTRRVVIEESSGEQFHDPTIREKAYNLFKGNLRKGETVFFEIVGYESTGASIMPPVATESLGKDFVEKYGEKMHYSYGCPPRESDVYVYRMTLTNEDGQTIDYAWDDVVKRCNEIGVKHVPHIGTFTLDELKVINHPRLEEDRDLKEYFSNVISDLGSGPSILDPSHIKEGVCVRIEGGLNNRTFKFKSFEFKVLEGIVKDAGIIDAEEAESYA